MFASQRDGVSALALKRQLEIGSYQTAWAMLGRLRSVLVRPGRERLAGEVEVDETFFGGEEPGLRGGRQKGKKVLVGASGAEAHKLLPGVHKVSALAKRWLLGTHQGSVDEAHLPGYLNEFVFRFNRRSSRSRGFVFYRVLELASAHGPVRYRELIANPRPGTKRRTPPANRGRPPSMERAPAGRPWRTSAPSPDRASSPLV